MSKLHQPMNRRQTITVLGILLAVGLLGWGAWELYGRWTGRPQSPAQVKRAIWKHLAKQSRAKEFNPPFDMSEAALAGTARATNKTGRVRGSSRARAALDMPDTTVSEYFRTNQDSATSYDAMYQLLGQQLRVTDHLLKGGVVEDTLAAMALAGEASIYARTNARDPWLSARICEAYLWPNLSHTESTNQAGLTAEAVLSVCDLAFSEAWETNRMARNYEMLIAKAKRPQSIDAARFRLALIYIDQGENVKALSLLKAITTIKTTKISREIARLEMALGKSGGDPSKNR